MNSCKKCNGINCSIIPRESIEKALVKHQLVVQCSSDFERIEEMAVRKKMCYSDSWNMQKKKIIIIMGREDPVKDLGGSGLTFYTFTPIG